jgi:hypothetical protein
MRLSTVKRKVKLKDWAKEMHSRTVKRKVKLKEKVKVIVTGRWKH